MVFLDGSGFRNETGAWRVPVVFDNLIHQGRDAGDHWNLHRSRGQPSLSPGQQGRFNRSYEYDALGGCCARFLDDEILPSAILPDGLRWLWRDYTQPSRREGLQTYRRSGRGSRGKRVFSARPHRRSTNRDDRETGALEGEDGRKPRA
jgi:hypothetical protein